MAELIIAMLWSVSPLGEAKVGIPYALVHDVNIYLAFIACFAANLLVFPIMKFFLAFVNRYFLKWRFYKKSAIFVARRAKTGAANSVQKYGFWGLLIFVMMPIPGTGVYAGSIAAYIFGIESKRAFWANAIGIFISCVFVWSATLLTMQGIEMNQGLGE